MRRRDFLAYSATAASAFARAAPTSFNKRERMLRWLSGENQGNYTPAAFFLHFGEGYKNGSAAAQKHLEYFHATGMDFVKIQFEQNYTRQDFLRRPADWKELKLAKLPFYEPLLVTVRELVKTEKKNALILMTLYSPFMCAGQCATAPTLQQHLQEDPESVKKGLEILTESQLLFVKACIKEGIDGFYASTQGGEASRFGNTATFEKYIKPFDLVSMKEAAAHCPFNILHVCDYVAPYANYSAYHDYPGHVINCNTRLDGDEHISAKTIARDFKRPFMGGLDRHGILVNGTPAQVEAEIRTVAQSAPKPFLLGADCTVPSEIDWKRLRHAIDSAHQTA